jgi:hypothetical protein
MPHRRSSDFSGPDLFDAEAAPARLAAEPASQARPTPRGAVLLPSDLEPALANLDETEFARLLAGVKREASRRNMSAQGPPEPNSQAAALAETRRKSKLKAGFGHGVTTTKANLVRAAIKAGVKPSAIARQFGLSKAAISEVLRSEER